MDQSPQEIFPYSRGAWTILINPIAGLEWHCLQHRLPHRLQHCLHDLWSLECVAEILVLDFIKLRALGLQDQSRFLLRYSHLLRLKSAKFPWQNLKFLQENFPRLR